MLSMLATRVEPQVITPLSRQAGVVHFVLAPYLRCAGHEEEEQWIDLATVEGYRRIVACQEAKDAVEAVLGCGAWRGLFRAMCTGRLLPTPWLNEARTVPLLLSQDEGLVLTWQMLAKR